MIGVALSMAFNIFFSNITMWGPKVHKYATEEGKKKDIIMMCETHMDKMKLETME